MDRRQNKARKTQAIYKTTWKVTKKAKTRMLQIRKTKRKLSTKRASIRSKMELCTVDNGLAGSVMEQARKPGQMEPVTKASG